MAAFDVAVGFPVTIPPDQLGEPFYVGSVQRLYAVPGDDSVMVTETTDAGSVFDVGSIFQIPESDVSRAVFRHALYAAMGQGSFWHEVRQTIEAAPELDEASRTDLLSGLLEELCSRGALTHHGGMLDAVSGTVSTLEAPPSPSAFNVVRRFQILKPETVSVLGRTLYDYSGFSGEDRFVVPLEYIVRFGITSGSSVYKRYQSLSATEQTAFQEELGVSKPLEAWEFLERPISDCTTKFEPEDRSVSRQEALMVSTLTGAQFERSMKMAVLGAWAVRHLIGQVGLDLWDIKWEFAKEGDDLVFVDTIDTDSFRATRRFSLADGRQVVAHFNKQSMRDYYRIMHADWMAGVNEAKARARTEGVPFTEILQSGQQDGRYPQTPEVEAAFLQIQVAKMTAIREFMLNRQSAQDALANLDIAGRAELDFYEANGQTEAFARLNQVG